MRISATFTKEFFSSLPANDTAGSSQQAQQEQAPLIYSSGKHGGVDDFINSADFDKFKQEYTALLDRITAFVHDHANKLNPPLSDETKKKVRDDFNVLKQHLFDSQVNFFGSHKPEVYGVGKEMFHAFEELLQNGRIPFQQRINAVVELAPRTRMCSGGVLSELQEVMAALKAGSHGLQGIAHLWKKKMMEALILEHIKATHDYFPGEEIHFVNAYYNKLADEMGVGKRGDSFVRGYEQNISAETLAQCKAHVFAKLKPTRLATQISDQYRNRIEESFGQEKIDLDKIDADGFNKLNTTLHALNPEYGEVSPHHFLKPVKEDWSEMAYAGKKRPMATTHHFLEQFKRRRLIDYDEESKLVLGKADESRVLMLDDLLWLKDEEGEVQEFTASAFFKIAPKEFLDNLEKREPKDTQERTQLLHALVERVQESLDAAGNAGDELGTWLWDFAAEMKWRSSWGAGWADPVMLLAATLNQASALSALLVAGGNKDAREEKSGQTLLMLAVRNGYAEVANILIEAKADVNAVDRKKDTALMIAIDNDNAEMIGPLVKAGADIKAKDNDGRTALMIAFLQGKTELVKALIEVGADIEAKDNNGHTALLHAVYFGKTEVAKALIEAGANIEVKAVDGKTMLMLALYQGKAELMKALMEAGADKEAKDKNGRTVLMIAVYEGKAEAVEALIEAGANKEAKDSNGSTALLLAVSRGKTEIVKALIKAGADIEAKDIDEDTALEIALYRDDAEMVNILTEAGARLLDE